MATLVHIADEKNEKSILKNGLRTNRHGVLYFMPMTAGYYASHQWCRELKRYGVKNFIAVYFKMDSDELIWYGKYNESHEQVRLGDAVSGFINEVDQLGFEMYVEKPVGRKFISKTKSIKKPMGWRYYPNAHGRKPCCCPVCRRGEYGQSEYQRIEAEETKSRRMSVTEAKKIISESNDIDELNEAVDVFSKKHRKESPGFLTPLLQKGDAWLEYCAILAISKFRHPLRKEILINYKSGDNDIKELLADIYEALEWSSNAIVEKEK